jgi:hypothetical protein
VFISWSGSRSREVAKTLREWLPTVVQAVRPWMSDTDIDKGSRSLDEITTALTGIKVGIVCLTPENLVEPWLLFEAGALSKTITDDKTRLCTYLLGGLTSSDVKQPLGMFQHTIADKEETRKLVHAINKAVSESSVPAERLNSIFDALWPQLQKTLVALPKFAPVGTTKRSLEDMVVEILELVRAEANARNKPPTWNLYTSSVESLPETHNFPDLTHPLNTYVTSGVKLSTLAKLVSEESVKSMAEKLAEQAEKISKKTTAKGQQKKNS